MNQLAYAPQPKYEFIIQIGSGPDKGAQFRVLGGAVRLGRSDECDIVLKDQKVSRLHAIIELKSNGVFIKEVSAKSRMKVDGQQTKQASLKKQSKIILGDTKINFRVEKISNNLPSKGKANLQAAGGANQYNYAGAGGNTPKRASGSSGVKKIMIGLLGLVVVFLMLPGTKKNNQQLSLRTTEEVQQEIEKNRKDTEQVKKALRQKQTKEFKAADAAYKKGFRNFKNGVFSRAIDNFQACLSLDKTHELCNQYLPLAIKRQNELIQYQMIVGRQQRNQNQFKPCQHTFENIMFMVKDKSNSIYKEAYENKEYCRVRIREQY